MSNVMWQTDGNPLDIERTFSVAVEEWLPRWHLKQNGKKWAKTHEELRSSSGNTLT